MTRSDEHAILKHLGTALGKEVGVSLEFLSPDAAKAFRQKVLEVRRKHPLYRVISTKIEGNELWLLRLRETPTSEDEETLADAGSE